jgi:hypothetical protein
MVPIVSGFELAVNHPDCGEGAGYVDYLVRGRLQCAQLTEQGVWSRN